MTRSSIRTQLIVWNVAALALLLIFLGLLIRSVVFSTMMASVDRDLENRTRMPGRHGPRQAFDGDGPHGFDRGGFDADGPPTGEGGPPPDDQRGPSPRDDPNRPRRFTLAGKPVGPPQERGALWDASKLANARRGEAAFSTVTVDGVSLRVLTRPFPERPPFQGITQASYPLTDVHRAVSSINRTLLLLSPVALLFAALGGALLTGRVLRQVRFLADSASAIRESDFSRRLPTSGRDEFSALAATFNGLLDRLETAFRRQERLMVQQRRFTGDASHELKTPLTVIKGNTSLALSGEDGMDVVSVREVDRAADTMMCLVQNLLLLARSDSGQLGRNRIELLVREVLERAMSGLGRRPGCAPISLKVADEALIVTGNLDELTRLFSNLLDNAARHTPPDGEITLTARRENESVIVTVCDTGSGIAPEHLPHLGERFYRIDVSRARVEGGTGLGISICRGIVESYGGTLTFASQPGVGTTVTITLPASNG